MSAIASSSDLSKQPSQLVSLPNASLGLDVSLGYNHKAVKRSDIVRNFVDSSTNTLSTFRHLSPTLSGLPFKSALLRGKSALPEILEAHASAFANEREEYDCMMEAAVNVAQLEKGLFHRKSNGTANIQTTVRKLLLAPGDKALFEPLAMVDQAYYFGKMKHLEVGRWISLYCPFIAYDLAASYYAPWSVTQSPVSPEAEPYLQVPLERKALKNFETLTANYTTRLSTWIEAFAVPQEEGSGHAGVYDMISAGHRMSLEGTSLCNVGVLVLSLQYILRSKHDVDNDLLVEKLDEYVRRQTKEHQKDLPVDFFGGSDRVTTCVIALLCAALISPLTLLMGLPLYGRGCTVSAHQLFMFWQQLGYLERPEWLIRRERELMEVVLSLVWCDDPKVDAWALFTKLAVQWKEEDSRNPPDARAVSFFENRLVEGQSLAKRVYTDMKQAHPRKEKSGGSKQAKEKPAGAIKHPVRVALESDLRKKGQPEGRASDEDMDISDDDVPKKTAPPSGSRPSSRQRSVQPTANAATSPPPQTHPPAESPTRPASSGSRSKSRERTVQPNSSGATSTPPQILQPSARSSADDARREAQASIPDEDTPMKDAAPLTGQSASGTLHTQPQHSSVQSSAQVLGPASAQASNQQNEGSDVDMDDGNFAQASNQQNKGGSDDEDEESAWKISDARIVKAFVETKRWLEDGGGSVESPKELVKELMGALYNHREADWEEFFKDGEEIEEDEWQALLDDFDTFAEEVLDAIEVDVRWRGRHSTTVFTFSPDGELIVMETPPAAEEQAGEATMETPPAAEEQAGEARTATPPPDETQNKPSNKRKRSLADEDEEDDSEDDGNGSAKKSKKTKVTEIVEISEDSDEDVPVKQEQIVVRSKNQARKTINTSWNDPEWRNTPFFFDSDIEEIPPPIKKTPQGQPRGHRTPVVQWSRSCLVRAFGGPKRKYATTVGTNAAPPPSSDDDGLWSPDPNVASKPKAPENAESGPSVEKKKKKKKLSKKRRRAMKEPDPTASDRDYKDKNDSGREVQVSKNELPFKCVNPDDDLSPVLVYDVRIAFPRTVVWRGRQLVGAIDKDARALELPVDINWIDTFSLPDWNAAPLEKIDEIMSKGHVVVIRDTNLCDGWKNDMHSATRIKSGAGLVHVQDFANRHRGGGIVHDDVPLVKVVDPEHQDPNKVYNLLNAPQETPLVQIPRQSDLDYSAMALKARTSKVGDDAEALERQLDWNIRTGMNWAIISQRHAASLGHVDTAGVYTAILILTGVKYWAIRKTVLEGRTEIDVNNVEYFVDLADRDFADLPGHPSDWVPLLLFPGDILIIPPHARHAVFTILQSMMTGIHFYYHTQLERSLCGWICSRFTTKQISNASHDEFLSVLQAFATFWQPGFSKKSASLSPEDPVMRTKPDPNHSRHGLSNLVSIAVALVFNDTLSGDENPYRGHYYVADVISFKKIWTSLSKEGYMTCKRLNYRGASFKTIVGKHMEQQDVWDDRWTCAGLSELLIHAARAIIKLSILWEEQRERDLEEEEEEEEEEDKRDAKGKGKGKVMSKAKAKSKGKTKPKPVNYLHPELVRARAIVDVSFALAISEDTVAEVVGTMDKIKAMKVNTIFPEVSWVSQSPRNDTRIPSLWDALYDVAHGPGSNKKDDLEEDGSLRDVDDDEDADADVESDDDDDYGRRRKKGKKAPKRKRH